MEDPYVTYKYMETVLGVLKQIYNKDLMYKHTLFSLSPKAEQIELFMK
jgi:isoleucyl-tRNA synthetase